MRAALNRSGLVLKNYSWEEIKDLISKRFGLLLFALILFIAAIGFFTYENEEMTGPCTVNSLQQQCYSVEQGACLILWNSLEPKCTEILPKIMKRPFKPTELISPKVNGCRKILFDKTFHYMRKTESGSKCESLFSFIEENKRDYE